MTLWSIVGHERGDGRFADSAFLCCKSNECFLVHFFIHFSVCFNRCWFIVMAVHFSACLFLRFCIYAQAHFPHWNVSLMRYRFMASYVHISAYPFLYGGLDFDAPLIGCRTTVRHCVSKPVRQSVSGAVCPCVREDLLFQMSVYVHIHFFKSLVRRFCVQRKRYFFKLVSFGVWWQLVAASGREWLRSYHVFKGLNALPLHPSGRAMPKARTAAPGSVLLLGSRRVSGDRYLYGIVITGISPIRPADGFLCPG